MSRPGSAPGLLGAVSARGLDKRFGHRYALKCIDLEVPSSGVFALFGPNGAGKSTLLRLVAGLARPSGGELLVLGEDHRRAGPRLRAGIGAVLHESLLRGDLTLWENLAFYGELYGLARAEVRERGLALLGRLGLAGRRDDLVRTFSQGMARRAAIARSLLHRPRLWLLDEPFSGLDPEGREVLSDLIEEERAAKTGIVLVTHDVELGLRLADGCALLAGGRVAAVGREAVEERLAGGARLGGAGRD
jgi:heme exporter protein A